MIVEGTVNRVLYAADDGSFAVLRVDAPGREGPLTAVGALGGLSEGEPIRLEGTWERHAAHGDQLRVERAIPLRPRNASGVERYLEGLKGVGPRLAQRLVEAFGVDAVEVIEDQPWRAAQLSGVGKKRAARMSDELRARRGDREVLVFLHGHGISAAHAARIRRVWGDSAIARLRENPYLLAREIPGIGFQTADRIARAMGVGAESPQRREAGIYHALSLCADEGSVYAPEAELVARAGALLAGGSGSGELPALDAAQAAELTEPIERLCAEGVLIRDRAGVWLPRLHLAEVALARRILEIGAAPRSPPPWPRSAVAQVALKTLSDEQRRAVESCRSSGVCVITGGPGTGKTTVVRAIVAMWDEARRRTVLAAPTGRAAKRLAEASGRSALTVHRLLEWGRGERGAGRSGWGRNEQRPIDADLVVVDEASMLDMPLARALLQAVPPGATLVLVGDVDQLPSVGPGQVLADVIASREVPVARLTRIFRQGEGSGIIENAHRVLDGQVPRGAPEGAGPRGDFFVVSVDDPTRAREIIVRLCRERIPEVFGLHPTRDVQVLTPMHRGEAGTEQLNRALQEALNPAGVGAPRLARGTRAPLRPGDKVLQSRNDYDRDVYNGDVGEVIAISVENEAGGPWAEVSFDDRRVRYDAEALGDLELAYAVSIHKSQGSEYPAVVIALLPQHFLLLQRNLLYTAITRGKRLVVLVGAPWAIRRAVETGDAQRRYTRLRERLVEGAANLGR